jgi:hypothetical protein
MRGHLKGVTSFDMPQPPTERQLSPRKYIFILWFTFLTAMASIPAYYRMFTGFQIWDDEGALMVTVKQYLSGMKLYNQVSVPYGPVYYFYNWALRTLSGTPLTHDVVRMSSLLPWLLTAFVSAWIVFRLTDSQLLASIAHLLVFFTLSRFFPNEPGHPQELCALLLVCLVASGVLASTPRWRSLGMILLGAFPAALILVKVNIGTFGFLATSLAILAHSRKTPLSRLSFNAIGAACVFLPAILMKAHWGDPRARLFAVLVTVSMVAVLLVLFKVPRACCFPFRDSLITIAAFLSAFIALILVLKAQGVALTRMLHALLLDNLGPYVVHGSWYIPLPFPPGRRWYFWTIGGLVLAGYSCWSASEKERREKYLPILKLLLAFLLVVVCLFKVSRFDFVLFVFLPPLCWIVLFGRSEKDSEPYAFPRTLLCTVTVIQMLYAYPIAGSQFHFVQTLPAIVAMICLGDVLAWQQKRLRTLNPLILRTTAATLLLCVAASYIVIARRARKDYNALPSLQLPSSGRIHLPETQAQDYRWLVRQLDDHCDVFVGFPELPSLHIWTKKDPLDGMQMNDWMLYTSGQQQMAVSAVLSEHPNACAIYNPRLVDFWNRTHQDLGQLPLVRYLHENFKIAGTSNQFSFLVRNKRDLTIASDP